MPTIKDDATQATITIDYPHHEVHENNHFFVTDVATVDNASPKRWRITTPNTTKWAHWELAMIFSAAAGLWELYEDPTLNAAGTSLTVFNSNRNSATAATCTVFKDTTTQAPNNDGTRLAVTRTGSGTNPSTRNVGGDRASEEIILKQNEDYILKFTPDGNGVQCSMRMTWYEKTNVA